MQETQWQPYDDSQINADSPAYQDPSDSNRPHASHKQAPQDSAFELERPGNRRLKKAPILLLVGAVGVLLASTIYLALRPVSSGTQQTQHALIDPEAIKRAIPDSLKLSDRDFAQPEPETPELGPPLQGDLGGLQLKPVLPLPTPASPLPKPAFKPPPQPKQPSPEELAKLRREALARQMAEKALTAGLFFDVPTQPQESVNPIGAAGNSHGQLSPQMQQSQALIHPTGHFPNPALQQQHYQQLLAASRQGQGAYGQTGAFPAFGTSATSANNPQTVAQLQAPGSPYQVKAGTLIPAVLLTGINADLPGQIIAQVREQVFDSVTGRYLLIPQGTRVLGQYDNNVGYGQERAGVVWNRLILPDGASIQLGNMPGVDSMGQSGYQDQVNHHWGRLATGVMLSSLLAGTAGYQGQRNDYAGRFYENVGMEINRAGQRLTRNNLNIQPTIQIRPGFSINILVNRDLTLKPIAPNQSNPWEAGLFPVQHQ